jgi:hypothetical protein
VIDTILFEDFVQKLIKILFCSDPETLYDKKVACGMIKLMLTGLRRLILAAVIRILV